MKTNIDIVAGFLDAGKTTFINKLLAETSNPYKKILILQCELGEAEILDNLPQNVTHIIEDPKKRYGIEDFEALIKEHHPDYMLIEHNGMQPLSQLVALLTETRLRRLMDINHVYQLIDASTYKTYIKNFGELMNAHTMNSSAVILNRLDKQEAVDKERMTAAINRLNRTVEIFEYDFNNNTMAKLTDASPSEKQKQSTFKKAMYFCLASIMAVFIVFGYPYLKDLFSDVSRVQVFITVFISILVQAIPFILLGVIVSSVIQIFVSEDTVTRLFPRNNFIGMIAGVVFGAAFPVCDCAVVPVASRLIRKGVPVSAAITFMLSSPIVNPVVIIATYYAFPYDHNVVWLRVLLGVIISIMVGAVFAFMPHNKNEILLDRIKESSCSCGYCSSDQNNSTLLNRFTFIFTHSGIEFVQTMKYLIIGAFLSTLMQFAIPQDTLIRFGNSQSVLPLIVMMLAAFILSICSTSDAFIARTFVGKFAMTPILGFLVLGPMIDVKNLMMLFGNFKPRFVLKLVISLLIISFIAFNIVSIFLV